MRSLWEHILLEQKKEKTYPTYTATPKSIWQGIKYKTIDGASEARERCNTDPDGLLEDLGVSASKNNEALDETEVIQDLYKIYEEANRRSKLSNLVMDTAIVQNSSGTRKGIKIRFNPLWKNGYQNPKTKVVDTKKSMQICCFWMKSIAVAAFQAKRVKGRVIDGRTETGATEGNLKVEVVEGDDVILVYLERRIEQWDM